MVNKLEERISQLRFMDDKFLKVCFKDHPEMVELILRIVLDNPDIKVSKSFTQDHIANINGKSVILDIIAEDTNDILYDIEVQRSDQGANIRRLRYISAMLDSRSLDVKKEYKELGDTYIIFITENDYFKKGKQVYNIIRTIKETGEKVNDGLHLIYVNSSYKSDNELGKLCHDFLCKNPEDMKIPELKKLSRHYKVEGGKEPMSSVFEEVKEEGREEGREEGMLFMLIELVKDKTLTIKEAAKKIKMSENEFSKLLV